MSRILVTGATGFIGSYVVPALLKNGCQVIATSRSEEKARKFAWFSQVTYIPFDLSSFDEETNYFQFFGSPDAAIHLAWEGLPNYTAIFHSEVNLPRHFSLLYNLLTNGMTDLTVTGTCFEYGMHEGMLSEDMPSDPGNAYALAKDALRKSLLQLQQTLQFNFKWIRLFYMYGTGQNPNSLLSQLQKAIDEKAEVFNMSGGEQVRDYLPVEKVAEYIVKIALQNRVEGIINCCSGKPVSVKQLVEEFLQRQNFSLRLNTGYYPYTDYEPMAFWGDNNRLNQIINKPN
jgi:nucleoside-diphosphate-sugar epimerase